MFDKKISDTCSYSELIEIINSTSRASVVVKCITRKNSNSEVLNAALEWSKRHKFFSYKVYEAVFQSAKADARVIQLELDYLNEIEDQVYFLNNVQAIVENQKLDESSLTPILSMCYEKIDDTTFFSNPNFFVALANNDAITVDMLLDVSSKVIKSKISDNQKCIILKQIIASPKTDEKYFLRLLYLLSRSDNISPSLDFWISFWQRPSVNLALSRSGGILHSPHTFEEYKAIFTNNNISSNNLSRSLFHAIHDIEYERIQGKLFYPSDTVQINKLAEEGVELLELVLKHDNINSEELFYIIDVITRDISTDIEDLTAGGIRPIGWENPSARLYFLKKILTENLFLIAECPKLNDKVILKLLEFFRLVKDEQATMIIEVIKKIISRNIIKTEDCKSEILSFMINELKMSEEDSSKIISGKSKNDSVKQSLIKPDLEDKSPQAYIYKLSSLANLINEGVRAEYIREFICRHFGEDYMLFYDVIRPKQDMKETTDNKFPRRNH